MRPWLFAEIPGLQILSLSSERETRGFAQRLQDVKWLTPLLLPPGVDGTISAPSSLFLRHFAGDAIAARISADIGVPTFAFYLFWQDTSIVFPSEAASRDWSAGRDYLSLDFIRVTGLASSRVPIWYRDGMGELLRSATGSSRGVSFPARAWTTPLGPVGAPARSTMNVDPFAGLALEQPRMPLAELFTVRPGAGSMSYRAKSAEDHLRYVRGATLFVHWGFFDNGGRRREAFLRLVGEAVEHPPDDAMVQRLLGYTLKELQTRLDRYAIWASSAEIRAPKDLPLQFPAAARPATRGEVARILGEAYLRLANSVTGAARSAYLDNAREVLEDARDQGEADAAVLHQLGVLALENGEMERAGEWLEQAVAGNVPRLSAYVTLAELRLKRLAAERPGDSLSAAETATVWSWLKQADALRPRVPATYGLGLAMWQNSSTRPTAADFALLADGVDAFPAEASLMRDALRAFTKLGANLNPAIEARMSAWRERLGKVEFLELIK